MRYSFPHLLVQSWRKHRGWAEAWREPEFKQGANYDVIVVGGGGHGLSTAYYLAKHHRIGSIAVLEKGYIGGGNTGRNTTVIRSNYLFDESAAIYSLGHKLWGSLTSELDFNLMFSARGVFNLGHSLQDMRDIERRAAANQLNGLDSQVLSASEVKKMIPIIDTSRDARYPILGASYQPSGGIARHDAIAWGMARGASGLGVEIFQNCAVEGIDVRRGRVVGVRTSRGKLNCGKLAVAVAGDSSTLARMAGFTLPIESHPLQAFVSEPMKPVLHTVVMSGAVHAYVSQSDKGDLVIGAGIDGYSSYAQRGSPSVNEHTAQALLALFPIFSRAKINRTWAGTVDVAPDASPIIGLTPVDQLYINCGWGTGGFKATPGSGYVFAHTVACDRPHEINQPFGLERFESGSLIDEHGAAAVAH